MLNPASGNGIFVPGSKLAIRLLRQGCTNRPFYHVVVAEVSNHKNLNVRFYIICFQAKKDKYEPVIEQLGTFDPYPNEYNEKLVALNYERIRYWIGNGAFPSKPVEKILGILLKKFIIIS